MAYTTTGVREGGARGAARAAFRPPWDPGALNPKLQCFAFVRSETCLCVGRKMRGLLAQLSDLLGTQVLLPLATSSETFEVKGGFGDPTVSATGGS